MGFQMDVKTGQAWQQELQLKNTLQVVEVYSAWCGPCKAIVSTFKRIFFDAGDRQMKFYTASVSLRPKALESCLSVVF
jgi:thioredoxin 1